MTGRAPLVDGFVPTQAEAAMSIHDTEAVVWPIGRDPVLLDPVASAVFQLLDGEVCVGDLVADIHDVIGIPETIARAQVARSIELFDQTGLLATSPPTEPSSDGLDLFHYPPNT